jgi:hypothetical protein
MRAGCRSLPDLPLYLCFQLLNQSFLRISLLLRTCLRFGQIDVADEVHSGVCEGCLVLGFLGDSLIILSLVDRRIDLRENKAFFDVLTLREKYSCQFTVHLGAHGDSVEGLRSPNAVEVDWDIGDVSCGRINRNSRGP